MNRILSALAAFLFASAALAQTPAVPIGPSGAGGGGGTITGCGTGLGTSGSSCILGDGVGIAYTSPGQLTLSGVGGLMTAPAYTTNSAGSVTSPVLYLNGDTTAGFYHNATSQMTYEVGGTNYLSLGGTFVRMGSAVDFCWASGDSTTGCATKLTSPSAGAIAAGNAASLTGGQYNAASIILSTYYSAAGTPVPTCNTAAKGTLATVSDATSPTYHGAYTSGGAVISPVFCNGTSWLTN